MDDWFHWKVIPGAIVYPLRISVAGPPEQMVAEGPVINPGEGTPVQGAGAAQVNVRPVAGMVTAIVLVGF